MPLVFAADPMVRALAASARPDVAREVVRFTGEFDAPSARTLGSSLASHGTGSQIHLDFSRVSRFSDRGVAALASILGGRGKGPEVVFHGLRQHQIRLFRYFGLDVERPVSAALPADPATLLQ